MAINADKPQRWKQDIARSVDLFNTWFIKFAPAAYRETRAKTAKKVGQALKITNDLRSINPEILRKEPGILPTLRMATSPPLARDRLVGLAYTNKSLIHSLERGTIPPRMAESELRSHLERICKILRRLFDQDVFPWLEKSYCPDDVNRQRASAIIADRLCGAVADPIIRNAQEQRQLALIGGYLKKRGYAQKTPAAGTRPVDMQVGTFTFRWNVPAGRARRIKIPVDVVIQPKRPRRSRFPILIEAKSAGDFTNTNKRRKEEATKVHQLRAAYGRDASLTLFLCGYFNSGYLGYEAAEGLDWIWEHRIEESKIC